MKFLWCYAAGNLTSGFSASGAYVLNMILIDLVSNIS